MRSNHASATERIPWLRTGAIVLLLLSAGAQPAQAVTSGGWHFSWSDEFNGPSIDTTVWGYESGYVRNSELQYYTNRPENSRIDNGNLLIQAKRDNWNGHEYTAASRRTMGRKSWLYGRFEMRAKIDIRQGSWPAWWWLPNSGGWPKGGEIDMMEFYQSKCLLNVMDGNQRWASVTRTVTALGGSAWAGQFHVWTWVWDSTKIDLSLDGVLLNHYLLSKADGTGPSGANPFRRPGYMLVNQAIGGTNGGDPTGTAFPVDFRVDWIRVHTWSAVSAYILTVVNGTGSDTYVPGTIASLTALPPSSGKIFDKWVVTSGSASIDSVSNASALLTMPTSDLTVTATYKQATGVVDSQKALRIHQGANGAAPVVYDMRGRVLDLSLGVRRIGRPSVSAGAYFVVRVGRPLSRVALDR